MAEPKTLPIAEGGDLDLDAVCKMQLGNYVAAMDDSHRAAIAASGWWTELKRSRTASSGTPGDEWVTSGIWGADDNLSSGQLAGSRVRFPTHYVMGLLSPFYMEGMVSGDGQRCTWAVSFSPFAENAVGHGQGGAIAAIFDLATASLGAQSRGGNTPTASLAVRYRRPLTPIPGVFRLDAELLAEEEVLRAGGTASARQGSDTAGRQQPTRRVYVRAKLTDGSGELVYDTADAVLVDLKVERSKL